MGFVYFVVLVGALVFVHELGHFLFAKAFGVRVLKFSVGFGPRVTGFRVGETDYVLGLIPLGGYVQMWGENPEEAGQSDDPERHRSFRGQPVWRRAVIVLAGPTMNLLFPLFLFFVVFLGDDLLSPPIIGTVFPGRPADGQLFSGDEIVSIDGEPITTFEELRVDVGARPEEEITLGVRRDGVIVPVVVRPASTVRALELGRSEEVGRLGIDPYHRTSVVGVMAGEAAALSGMRSFDQVIAVRATPIETYEELEDALDEVHSLASITFLRPERQIALGGLVELSTFTPHVANLNPASGRAPGTLRVGLEGADLYVHSVELDSPEAQMGLLPGDRIVTLDGRPVRLWPTLLADLRADPGSPHTLTWKRGIELHEGTLRLQRSVHEGRHGQVIERVHLGISGWMPLLAQEGVANPSPLSHAWRRAREETAEMISLTLSSAMQLFEGQVGVQSIGGPLMMFDAAGEAARGGATDYLKLMAFISINLGLLNLLPIPMLDGGHLLFMAIETTTRRQIHSRIRKVASLLGLLLLMLLMGVALKNDIDRLSGSTGHAETSTTVPR